MLSNTDMRYIVQAAIEADKSPCVHYHETWFSSSCKWWKVRGRGHNSL